MEFLCKNSSWKQLTIFAKNFHYRYLISRKHASVILLYLYKYNYFQSVLLIISLNPSSQFFQFYSLWKRQKTKIFLTCRGVIKMKHYLSISYEYFPLLECFTYSAAIFVFCLCNFICCKGSQYSLPRTLRSCISPRAISTIKTLNLLESLRVMVWKWILDAKTLPSRQLNVQNRQ